MGRLDRTIRVAVWALVMGWPAVACGWGRIGHDAVAYIAECNLSPKAQRIAEKYLGHSIVYFSSWMDDYRRSPGYEHTTYWHMAPVDERMYYTDEVRERHRAVEELQTARRFDGCGQSSLRDSSGRRHALSRPCRLPRRRAVVRRFVQREKAQLP